MSGPNSAYPAIRLKEVTRIFSLKGRQRRVAVDNLSLEVPCGNVFGFLGANGAGKTTTIKMLLGFLPPTHGRLEIMGESCRDFSTRRHCGYLPEQPYFHPFLTPEEVLRVHSDIVGLSRRERIQQTERLLALTQLEKNAKVPLGKLSKGNQQRVGIAQALIGNPPLLILDEPTSGLDPIGRHEMREIIASLRSEGATVFLSSHVLSEIDTLCDRVAILSHGRLVASGTPDEIKQGDTDLTLTVQYLTPSTQLALRPLDILVAEEREVTIVTSPENLYEVIAALEKERIPILSIRQNGETLEDAFLRLAA